MSVTWTDWALEVCEGHSISKGRSFGESKLLEIACGTNLLSRPLSIVLGELSTQTERASWST
jgi:hypothetical protein